MPPPALPPQPRTVQENGATLYVYRNPVTQEVIKSHLPPDHPQMICVQQGHIPQSHFGIIGIIAAIVFFPIGIALCLLDRRVRCERCGYIISDGC